MIILILKNILKHFLSLISYLIPITSIFYFSNKFFETLIKDLPKATLNPILFVPLAGLFFMGSLVIDLNIQILEHIVLKEQIFNQELCIQCKQYCLYHHNLKDIETTNLSTNITNLKTYYK